MKLGLAIGVVLTFASVGVRAAMAPMEQIGPQPRPVNAAEYARVLRVGAGGDYQSLAEALTAVTDASAQKRYAILCASALANDGGTTKMKPHVDLYGGFSDDWKTRDVYAHQTVLAGHDS